MPESLANGARRSRRFRVRTVSVPFFSIPTGLQPSAQGCEALATLGGRWEWSINPNGVVPRTGHVSRNPVGVDAARNPISQGSSFLATLGCWPESRWDSSNEVPELRIMTSRSRRFRVRPARCIVTDSSLDSVGPLKRAEARAPIDSQSGVSPVPRQPPHSPAGAGLARAGASLKLPRGFGVRWVRGEGTHRFRFGTLSLR